jgi:carbon monoxide dehydrogenase subunit G
MTTLNHSFHLPIDRNRAWDLLTDLNRVASCMPGAAVETVENGTYKGRVRVKLGGIKSEFRGEARFQERDDETQRYKIIAAGRESRGQGSARATVELSLDGTGGEPTQVSVVTSLDTAGRIAQFGRAMLQDVSEHLLDEFVGELERQFGEPGGAGAEEKDKDLRTIRERREASAATRPSSEGDDHMDVGRLAGAVLSRRLLPVGGLLIGLVVGSGLGGILGRRARRRSRDVRLYIGLTY